MGAGGFEIDDAQSVVYNMEFYKTVLYGYTYCPNAYITKEIGSDEWDDLLDAAAHEAEKEYKPVMHNCAHVAIYIWNHAVDDDISLFGIDTPTSLYSYLSDEDGVIFDMHVELLAY